jgi:indolepyruvate ferredoxin oxidoreductase, beta subunit
MVNAPENRQIFLSGVGGQGILFITRLLAETAVHKGYNVLTAETHGMAQRGGVVVSHLKVGAFSSPLVRPGMADVLILLKSANLGRHGLYSRPGGAIIVNSPAAPEGIDALWMDADAAACRIDQRRSMNLVLTGFAISALNNSGRTLFCSPDDIRATLNRKLSGRGILLTAALSAFDYGINCGERKNNGLHT